MTLLRIPRTIIFGFILVCFLAEALPAFGQCTAPSFAPAANFAAGNGPQLMAVGDFNGDGKRDLAVPNVNADSVTILLGNGSGSFTSGGSYTVGHQPTSAAAGDFNGDGKLDLAVVNFTSFGTGDMSILIGTGMGTFGAPTSYRVIAFNNSVTVSDLNNDGKLDIVAGTYSENLGNVKVLLGDGTGNFGAIADFGGNGDGYSAVVGDFNSDGKRDVAIAINSEVGQLFGTGTRIQVLLGDGSGGFGAATNFAVGTGPTSIAVGDLNGDGKLDLAVANVESDNVSVLLGNGVGGFEAAANFTVQDFPNSVALGDLNGDGKPDLAVSNARSNTVSVLLGNGSGSFSTPTNFAVGTSPGSVVVSDFNGDNKSDLAIANFGSDNVSVLLNTCSVALPNPIDDPSFFVRQHYLDFLNRTPDPSGLDFWTHQITDCGTDQACTEVKRINVSAAFFLSIEFQETGYLAERLYKSSYGDVMGSSTIGGTIHQLSVPIVRFDEFLADTQQIDQGVIVGEAGWEQVLENNKQAFIATFVQRSRFTTAYPESMPAAQFVDTLNTNAGGVLAQAERDQLVADLGSGAKSRAQVLRAIAEDADLSSAEKNRAFVLTQYFGYLRRNPNDLPDSDYSGYDFWLTKLNEFNGNFINAEMVKAFITSFEYRGRFGP